jgi:hypothetical protein
LVARKKLLKAIASLSAALQPASVTEAVPPAITPAAERRQLNGFGKFCHIDL